ncbi:MAG: heavy-metal-associated domain-containing protein, partial [Armatimonadetes bacterium]|nr:heavy-metal-associated domain-containing protein [Armatimonadota bacterium]
MREQARLELSGMTCASCAARIEKSLSRLEGVETASVNFATGKAVVSYDGERLQPADLVARVAAAGYGARLLDDEAPAAPPPPPPPPKP